MLEALKDKVDIEWFFEGWDNESRGYGGSES